jgi:hypothetical protein
MEIAKSQLTPFSTSMDLVNMPNFVNECTNPERK